MDQVVMSHSAFFRLKQLVTIAAGGDAYAIHEALGMLQSLEPSEKPGRTEQKFARIYRGEE